MPVGPEEKIGCKTARASGLAVAVLLLLATAGALGYVSGDAAFAEAQKHFQRTDYSRALQVLLPLKEKPAAALHLIGQIYYLEGDFDKAVDYFQQAVAKDPKNSKYYNWLGRAWGRKAETSSFLTAPRHAVRARQAFEKAVELDPSNLEAMEDLFEFYLQAPGFLGGGHEKAAALARRMAELDPAQGHWLFARLAEAKKQYSVAEAHLREAVRAAPNQVGRLIDLARFLARQGKHQESEEAFALASRMAPENPKLLYERAEALIETGKNLDEARRLLERYLALPLTPELPSRKQAQELLDRIARAEAKKNGGA